MGSAHARQRSEHVTECYPVRDYKLCHPLAQVKTILWSADAKKLTGKTPTSPTNNKLRFSVFPIKYLCVFEEYINNNIEVRNNEIHYQSLKSKESLQVNDRVQLS
jgi:hypothetical protein